MDKYHLTRTAVYMLLEHNDLYLFLRRKDTGWNDGKLTFPAGHVEKGETAVAAAIREAEEETSVIIKPQDVSFLHAQYVFDQYTNFYFKAEKWEGEPKINEPHLASELVWVPKTEIPSDAVNCVKHMLQAIASSSPFTDTPDDPGDGRFDGDTIYTQ